MYSPDMNPIEYVLDNLGRPVVGCLPFPYTLEEPENGDSSSAGVAWIGLVVGFKVNCPHTGPRPMEGGLSKGSLHEFRRKPRKVQNV